MKQTLFRKESIAYQRNNHLGNTLEIKTVYFACLTAVAILIALAIIIFFWLGEFTRKSHIEGYLAPKKEFIKVYSLQQGILRESKVQRTTVITAPEAGFVSTILQNTGQMATTSKALISIFPSDAKLEANLLVPSRSIGFIREGQVVTLHYQAFPYQRFGSYQGSVKKISKTSIIQGDTISPTQFKESIYRVTISLAPQQAMVYRPKRPLHSGMMGDADIWLDHRASAHY